MARYTTRILTNESDIAAITPSWECLLERSGRPSLFQHPAWIDIHARTVGWGGGGAYVRRIVVVTLHEGDRLVGLAPLITSRALWTARIGYQAVAPIPIVRTVLAGQNLLAPEEPEAHAALLGALAEATPESHLVRLECLPTSSLLFQSIQQSAALGEQYWIDTPPAEPRWRIDLPETFDGYVKSLGSRGRRMIRSAVKKLEGDNDGSLRVERCTRHEDLPRFFEAIEHISQRSWQGTKLGRVLRADTHGDRIRAYVDRGWLRGHVLRIGEAPVAFVLGVQAYGTYLYDEPGYDPAWAPEQPGVILLARILQDLCAENGARHFDFGEGDALYKRILSSGMHDEVRLDLVRKSVYAGAARFIHRTSSDAGRLAREALDKLGLRDEVRRLLRRGGAQAQAPE
ncbi:GNAT family N-acetyltransferase [Polyangium aurulentum]|uniref:GNAT family N-acetyltransferase n=1 Tax=Polyangium aurulentum TaxID=2567896 RepID=UPI00200FD29B|nr:GNAT family N-acetyltransferase [Polyangium aurulentum]UQA62095.1 GNAT family N-acetyltransferase [Polyangium aurulentum]